MLTDLWDLLSPFEQGNAIMAGMVLIYAFLMIVFFLWIPEWRRKRNLKGYPDSNANWLRQHKNYLEVERNCQNIIRPLAKAYQEAMDRKHAADGRVYQRVGNYQLILSYLSPHDPDIYDIVLPFAMFEPEFEYDLVELIWEAVETDMTPERVIFLKEHQ